MFMVLCLLLTLLSIWLLYRLTAMIIVYLRLRLYPTELIISPHEVSFKNGIDPLKTLPSVSLMGVRRARDGDCLEVLLTDGAVVEIGRGQAPEILDWLEVQLREHISSLRDRQGAAAEIPRALQDLRQ